MAPWIAPNFTELDFGSNCTLVGEFIGTWYDTGHGLDLGTLVRYFRAALPAETQRAPTAGQIVDWFNSIPTNTTESFATFRKIVLIQPRKHCQEEVCKTMYWSGNPDITGVGMVVIYFLEAVLVTIYACAISWDCRNRSYRYKSASGKRKLLDAFIGSVGIFLDAATIFSLSLFIAAIYVTARPSSDTNPKNLQEVTIGELIAFFSFGPVVVLYVLSKAAQDELRRKGWSRAILYGLLVILGSTEAWVAAKLRPQDGGETWELFCDDYMSVVQTRGLSGAYLTCYALWVLWALVFYALPLPQSWKTRILPYKRFGPWLVVVIGLMFTWVMLALSTITRQKIIDRSGNNNQENVWSFGQVLALWTWAPVLIDFAYIYIRGLKKGLQERVPEPWVVSKPTSSSSSSQSQGMDGQDHRLLPRTPTPSGETDDLEGGTRPHSNVAETVDYHAGDITEVHSSRTW